MMDLAYKIKTTKLKINEIAIIWLGQAGFIIKDSEDRLIAIDPYLTDCVERVIGFKRMMPKIIFPQDIDLDMLITSHDHLDHFDIDAVPIIMSNGRTKLLGSVSCVNKCIETGVDKSRLLAMKPGDEANFDGIMVRAVYADHGELAPDALGILLTVEGIKIYFAGDTAYSPEVIKTAAELRPDIAIVPINGEYGNLNSEEAAKLVRDCGARTAIPCHFWTFIMHRGDPLEFENQMKRYAPESKLKFFHQGEIHKFKS